MNANYTQSVLVNSTAENAFNALTSEIDKWWGSIDNPIKETGDIFTISFGNAYWSFKATEFEPNETITWKCIDGQPELNNEWIRHKLIWTIKENHDSISITLDQVGLTASLPCYEICSTAWDRFILISLKAYLETGIGKPE